VPAIAGTASISALRSAEDSHRFADIFERHERTIHLVFR
jgi:hypothetical protein